MSVLQFVYSLFGGHAAPAAAAPDTGATAAAATSEAQGPAAALQADEPAAEPEPFLAPGDLPPLRVELQRGVTTWTPPARDLARWAAAALGERSRGCEISVRVVGRAESRRLNAQYRGRKKPTNVLSFPAGALPEDTEAPSAEPIPLGDLVICADVLKAEAAGQGKPLRAHWAHLVVHGALHLMGHDHERKEDEVRMERLETQVLRRFGFPDPYRSG